MSRVRWCGPLPGLSAASSYFFDRTNSRPYFGAAASIFCISLYGISAAGGNVMACAGTLSSLNHPSSPAGVARMSIRNCSDSIANECATPRGRKTIVPGVALMVLSPTETVISPSSTYKVSSSR